MTPDAAGEIDDVLRAVLAQALPLLLQQLAVLEAAAAAMAAGRLDEVALGGARREAHRLRGSLGSLGLPHGSALAGAAESALAAPGAVGAAAALAGAVAALTALLDSPHPSQA